MNMSKTARTALDHAVTGKPTPPRQKRRRADFLKVLPFAALAVVAEIVTCRLTLTPPPARPSDEILDRLSGGEIPLSNATLMTHIFKALRVQDGFMPLAAVANADRVSAALVAYLKADHGTCSPEHSLRVEGFSERGDLTFATLRTQYKNCAPVDIQALQAESKQTQQDLSRRYGISVQGDDALEAYPMALDTDAFLTILQNLEASSTSQSGA